MHTPLLWWGRLASTRMARIAAAAALGVVLTCASVVVTALGHDSGGTALVASVRALIVAVPIAVGCYAWQRRPNERFGPMLVAAGIGWFLTTLAESNSSVLYSIGRIAGWIVELQLVYLILSFPSGRLPARIDRALVWAVGVTLTVLYLPSAPIDASYPLPAPYTSCQADCPANAFFVLGSEPGFVDSLVRPLRELLTVALFLAVTARVGTRVRHATRLMRRTLTPVLAVALARSAVLAIAVVVRRAAPDSAVVDALTWIVALGLPAMALGFFVGLVRWRLFLAEALQVLGLRLQGGTDAQGLRKVLAEALDDPSLWLAYSRGAGSVDADGLPVELPEPESGRCVTEVRDGDRRIAAIVHDEALRDQQQLVEAAAAYARIALENQHLGAKVESSLRELRESRARILTTADQERRRIERDLHDGAQQRLVALRIKLELAEELVREDQASGLAELRALGSDVDETLDEIRSLARGVYPAPLADQGLAGALGMAALHTALPAEIRPDGIGRYPPEVESAVYFCCLEALQNASKHAQGASRVTVWLAQDDALRFEVRDDGDGFDLESTAAGRGIANMRDRLAAIGGELTIDSTPGRGAVVRGSVPTRWHPPTGTTGPP
jgi:signal transduction histidine kinase